MKNIGRVLILLILFSFYRLGASKAQSADQPISTAPPIGISFFYDVLSASAAVIFLTNLIGQKIQDHRWAMACIAALAISVLGTTVEHQLSLTVLEAKDIVPVLLNALFIVSGATGGNQVASAITSRISLAQQQGELDRPAESRFFKSWF